MSDNVPSKSEPTDPEAMWRINDPVVQKFMFMRMRLGELRDDTLGKRMVIITGPPAINKSGELKLYLRDIYLRSHQQWLAEPEDRRPARRTGWSSLGDCYFIPPFVFRGGIIEAPAFFSLLSQCTDPDEFFCLDDVVSLNNRANRSMLHQASDIQRQGEVTRETNRTRIAVKKGELEGTTLNFYGKIIIVTNLLRDSKEQRLMFEDALQDRAVWIDFPHDPDVLLAYIDHTAFVDDPEQGLYKYLLAESSRTMPEDDRGLGFKGSEDEALTILSDVRQFFLYNYKRMRTLGYRTLRDWVRDRYHHPDMWRAMADNDLRPK